ncbi:MAG: KamA family radical SAM protein [Thermogutta sp.]
MRHSTLSTPVISMSRPTPKSSPALSNALSGWERPAGPDDSYRTPPWKVHVLRAIRDPAELCSLLGISPKVAQEAQPAVESFPLLLPRTMLSRINPGDPADPVLRQFLPTPTESAPVPGFSTDPLKEQTACPLPGIMAKYEGRILILASSACAVHCRYCFRRHFRQHKGHSQTPPAANTETAGPPSPLPLDYRSTDGFVTTVCEYLASREDCREVILSGGEPLLLDDEMLGEWFSRVSQVAHVTRLRIHTRLPVVIPQRVTPELVRLLGSTRLQSVVVLHINHPKEIDDAVADAITRLNTSGAILLCQSVLLTGVNDSPDILAALYEQLAQLRVLPYYLHQLDRVAGAHHFDVPIVRGRQILDELRQRLPGYLVPRYVQEQPGEKAKVPL